jgi:tritrans,polycis-undecaprenyl-diphosphate synthase [geranylgeranyl-diphosphate specific]
VERSLSHQIEQHPVPEHVAIIMDGNRRYAQQRGVNPLRGHEIGRDTLEDVVDWCLDVGIKYLTVYAFSTENFRRDTEEVRHLMDLFEENFRDMAEDERVHEHEIHVRAIGELEHLPPRVRDAIDVAEEATEDYDDYYYTIAVAYGGRREIIEAMREIASDVEEGHLDVGDIDESLVSKYLYTSHQPDPDLILRTSGEERISNFLLWQTAYSELYFTDVYWPGFRKVDFLRAIRDYQNRQRRFGE